MKDKWFLKPEMIVGLSALIVSLVAVLVAVYSAYIDRAYARASVWPRLSIARSDFDTNGKRIYEYQIINAGTGPAVNKHAYVTIGNKYYRSWAELFRDNDVEQQNGIQSFMSTRVLPANQSFSAYKTDNVEFIEAWRSIDTDIKIEICYCSVYDECWSVNRENKPVEVAECVVDPEKAFKQ